MKNETSKHKPFSLHLWKMNSGEQKKTFTEIFPFKKKVLKMFKVRNQFINHHHHYPCFIISPRHDFSINNWTDWWMNIRLIYTWPLMLKDIHLVWDWLIDWFGHHFSRKMMMIAWPFWSKMNNPFSFNIHHRGGKNQENIIIMIIKKSNQYFANEGNEIKKWFNLSVVCWMLIFSRPLKFFDH